MEISSTVWLPDITDWWRQQESTHWKFADLSNVACDIFSIIPHGVGVEASFSLGRDNIGWRKSKSTGKTLGENFVVRQFARANKGIFVGRCATLDHTETENDLELNKQGGGMTIWKEWPRSSMFGDVAGQPKPTCYTEGMQPSKHPNDSGRIHFRYQRDHQSILVKLSTWWCSCI